MDNRTALYLEASVGIGPFLSGIEGKRCATKEPFELNGDGGLTYAAS
jgi:hypothetical protein